MPEHCEDCDTKEQKTPVFLREFELVIGAK